MEHAYYIFAGYVFILVCAVVFLNYKLRRSRDEAKQEQILSQMQAQARAAQQAADDAAEQFMLQYARLEGAMRSLEEELQDAHEEIERQKQQSAAMLSNMQRLHAGMRAELTRYDNREKGGPAAARKKPEAKKKTTGDKVRELHSAGLNVQSIARELKVSYGEVDLALGLYKNHGG